MNVYELEECIKKYGTEIYSFCCHLTCEKQEADDLYQDTFLNVMEKLELVDIDNNPKSYLLAIAVNLWKNRKRKYAWRQRIAGICSIEENIEKIISSAVFCDVNSPEETLFSKESRKRVWIAVSGLPDKYNIPVYLYYMEELSVGEIAKIMKIPKGTVKSRLHKAREILKKELEDYYET